MKKYLFVIILLLFTACNDDVLYDRVGNIICTDKSDCGEEVPEFLGAPSTEEKFSQTLENSRLQYPDSATDVDYGEFDGVVREYFYLDKSLLTFQLNKQTDQESMRSELRFGPDNWDVSTEDEHILSARVRCFGSDKLKKYTFLQIHEYLGANLPLLRLAWERRNDGLTNYIWAGISTNRDIENRTFDWVNLGKREDGFFDINISVKNSKMQVSINGKVLIDKDVSYWNNTQNYYKAGLYLNNLESMGKTKVQFKKLEYIVK